MAPEVGFEPTTHALTVRYSTAELFGNEKSKLVAEGWFNGDVDNPQQSGSSRSRVESNHRILPSQGKRRIHRREHGTQ